jgi:hypothetical protein
MMFDNRRSDLDHHLDLTRRPLVSRFPMEAYGLVFRGGAVRRVTG